MDDNRVDGCGHRVVRCTWCGTDLINCDHIGGMSLTPGQRKTLAGIGKKKAQKRSMWKRIFGEIDPKAPHQGRG